jgi:hypothetical protein
MTTNTAAMVKYTDALDALPEECFLGSLLFFSICQADVDLRAARQDLVNVGLPTDGLRKNLRPIDAFRKSSKRFEHKFKPVDGVRSELMARPVGNDGEQSFRHLVLERAVIQAGKKRRVFYEKVGELTFTRGVKKNGEYVDHAVESRRTTGHLPEPLTPEEDQWLTEQLAAFEDNYDHSLHFMDSHAVRTFVRESIYNLGGVCVKETGGLYFVAQAHVAEVEKLALWVRSVGSQFHSLPMLNYAEQKSMIAEAFESEALTEIQHLMNEAEKILHDQDRTIEERTFDAFAERAADLSTKIQDYHAMLGTRADQAEGSLQMFGKQVLALSSRIRESKTTQAKVVSV